LLGINKRFVLTVEMHFNRCAQHLISGIWWDSCIVIRTHDTHTHTIRTHTHNMHTHTPYTHTHTHTHTSPHPPDGLSPCDPECRYNDTCQSIVFTYLMLMATILDPNILPQVPASIHTGTVKAFTQNESRDSCSNEIFNLS